MEMEITLPSKKVKATYTSPHILLIYGPPKVGKTTVLSQLPNCLILDLENGSKFLDALKTNVLGLEPPVGENEDQEKKRVKEGKYYLSEIGRAIHKAEKPYKYVALDTVTKLEEWCEWEGTQLYMRSSTGKNFNRAKDGLVLPRSKWSSVLTLPNGGGYFWLRVAMKKWLDKIYTLADHIILVGHLLDKQIEKKGKEVSAKDLDLTGKLKRIVCAHADAIGYLYRDEDKVFINFNTSDEVNCGSRCEHLKGQNISFDWKSIYR